MPVLHSHLFEKCSGYILLSHHKLEAEPNLLDFDPHDFKGGFVEQDEHEFPIISDRMEAFIKCRDLNYVAVCKLAAQHGLEYQGEKWFGVFQLGKIELANTTWDFSENYSLAIYGIGEVELSAKYAFAWCKPTADERARLDMTSEKVVQDLRNSKPAIRKPSKARKLA